VVDGMSVHLTCTRRSMQVESLCFAIARIIKFNLFIYRPFVEQIEKATLVLSRSQEYLPLSTFHFVCFQVFHTGDQTVFPFGLLANNSEKQRMRDASPSTTKICYSCALVDDLL
jgi:hypothetical protein